MGNALRIRAVARAPRARRAIRGDGGGRNHDRRRGMLLGDGEVVREAFRGGLEDERSRARHGGRVHGPKRHETAPRIERCARGRRGHVEVCQIRYDSSKTTYEDLVSHLFTFHDPTALNRQGNDSGSQYASVIFVHGETQRAIAEKVVRRVQGALDAGTIKAYAGGTVAARRGRDDVLPGARSAPEVPGKETRGILQPQTTLQVGRRLRSTGVVREWCTECVLFST